MRNRGASAAAAAVLALVAAHLPWFFYWRDLFSTHFPLRHALGGLWTGWIPPLWNPLAGGGQPLAGNPNALAFYPDALLSLVLAPFPAFNAHFFLHWLLGGVAMASLLRARGAAGRWPLLGGTLWAASGPAVSALAFLNLSTAVALIPFALDRAVRAAARPRAREALLLGVAFGLMGLAGEPVVLLGTAAAAAALTLRRPGKEQVKAAVVAIAVAVAVVSPQLLAWSEISAATERGARPYSAETVLAASLSPWQAAEMILGPVRGLATDLSPGGLHRSGAAERWPPLFLSLWLGPLALAAMLAPPRRLRREWASALFLLLLAFGRYNPVVAGIVERLDAARLLRYPEKLALPAAALLVVLMIGWLERGDRRGALAALAAPVSAAIALGVAGASWSPSMRVRLAAGIAVSAVILALALGRTARHRAAAGVATLAASLFLLPFTVPLDRLGPWREASPLVTSLAGSRIARTIDPAAANRGFSAARERYRAAAQLADPLWGTTAGVAYALDRSGEGMYSILTRIASERYASGEPGTVVWARLAGCEVTVHDGDAPLQGTTPRRLHRAGARTAVEAAVDGPLPPVRSVERVEAVRTIRDAVGILEGPGWDPVRAAVGPRPWRGAPLVVTGWTPQPDGGTIGLAPGSEGRIVVAQTWFEAWQARDQEGRALTTFPADLDRLGIEVPAGTTRVDLRFGTRRAAIGAAWAVSLLVMMAALVAGLKRTGPAAPAEG